LSAPLFEIGAFVSIIGTPVKMRITSRFTEVSYDGIQHFYGCRQHFFDVRKCSWLLAMDPIKFSEVELEAYMGDDNLLASTFLTFDKVEAINKTRPGKATT